MELDRKIVQGGSEYYPEKKFMAQEECPVPAEDSLPRTGSIIASQGTEHSYVTVTATTTRPPVFWSVMLSARVRWWGYSD